LRPFSKEIKKAAGLAAFFYENINTIIILLLFAVAAAELVNPSCSIHQLHFAGVIWMRSIGDFQFN
jgi:hypothetical protein